MIDCVGAVSASADGGTALTFPSLTALPVQAGDLLLAAIHGVPPHLPDPNVPWWPIGALTYNGNFTTTLWSYRVLVDDPLVYTWTWPHRIRGAEGTIATLRGCHMRYPIGVVTGRLISGLTGYAYRTPATVADGAGALVLAYGADAMATQNPEPPTARRWTPPPGTTELGDVRSIDNCASLHWRPDLTGGLVGEQEAGFTNRIGGTAFALILRAA